MTSKESTITIELSDSVAELSLLDSNSGSYLLTVDGVAQSQVILSDPTVLVFDYIRRIGRLVDVIVQPQQKVTALHLGGGALTVPRYIQSTRPGSTQYVVELERELSEKVLSELPLPEGHDIRFRYGDARSILAQKGPERLPPGDLVIVDLFSGAHVLPHVASLEFYQEASRYLKPQGVIAVNVTDGPGLLYAREQVATLASLFSQLSVVMDPRLLEGNFFGNVVIFASNTNLEFVHSTDWLGEEETPSRVIAPDELASWIGAAEVLTDLTARPSPPADREYFAAQAKQINGEKS